MTTTTATSTTLEREIDEHVATAFDDDRIVALRRHYLRHGYVKVRDLVPRSVFETVHAEVLDLLDRHARRIDIHLKETGDSPRYMSTVSQQAIAQDAVHIPVVYASESLKGLLSRIAAEPVVDCPWDEEKYVIIRQERVGDTHGWHWGDFSFTVIWLMEAPPATYGGTLQCVPHTTWDKHDPDVDGWLAGAEIEAWDHVTGDLYFLRSDTTLHRTIPLNQDATRIILNTCWGSESDARKQKTHETMEAMFE
jgi:hypothetical protein